MKNVPMRFSGYTFHHNPAELKIEQTEHIIEQSSPCCEPINERIGSHLRLISGEGELYGADCIARFREMQGLLGKSAPGLLLLPHMPAMYAYLKELRMLAEPKENVLGYRFVFIEAQPPARDETIDEYYETAVLGESLWDISYRFCVPIGELVRLNPQISYIDSLKKGERVRLCCAL